MRVALINNMNNMFFATARYLRDAGVEAHLYVMPDGHKHFSPECDTFQAAASLDWIHPFPVGESLREFWERRGERYEWLHDYDAVIGCGAVTAQLARAGTPVDMLIPYGQELIHDSRYAWRQAKPHVNLVAMWRAYWQCRAFRQAHFVVVNAEHKIYGDAVKRIGIRPESHISLPAPAFYNREEAGDGEWSFLRAHDFVVFYHGRQMWATNPDNLPNFKEYGGNKRNDVVIRAFARFLARTAFRAPLLVMFEYGPDVDASKALIAELGIADRVCWRPLCPRKVIMQGLRLASLATEHFRPKGCGMGGTGLEAMGLGIPLLTHTNGAISTPGHFLHNAPLIDALTVDEVLGVFVDYERRPGHYKDIGARARQWFDQTVGTGNIARYVAMLEQIVAEKAGRATGGNA
jgi:glycosyltransferase involved in cell wall biosynthesis